MEIEDLKTIWEKYDNKLDNLEKLNKKLVMEIISKKPQRKLNWLKFKSMYGLIMPPIILVLVFGPRFRSENIDLNLIIGSFLILTVMVYLGYISVKSVLALRGVDLSEDSVIESARKVNNYLTILNVRHKYSLVTYPLLFLGTLLVIWNGIHFDTKTTLEMIGLFVLIIYVSNKQFKVYRVGIERLENEILELEEYEK